MAPHGEAPTPRHLVPENHADRLAGIIAGDPNARGGRTFKDLATSQDASGTKPCVLPPDVSAQQFERFVTESRRIIGADNVFVNAGGPPEDASYEKQPRFTDYFVLSESVEDNMASAAVRPASVDEVREIVKLANETTVPLHAISIGRNLGYGGTSPRLKGAVILDLKRMNKILEINEESGYCLVEPGVSYFDLYEEIQRRGLKLWIDCPDIGWGSVLGNACDRGAGYTPYGDHFMMHCGMEVVLPTGDLIRTGQGAMTNTSTWQTFPFGPYPDGIFSQSNLGVVTKMGMWLMSSPASPPGEEGSPGDEGFEAFLITVPRREDLAELIDRIRPLRLAMVIQNAPTIRHVLLDAACTKTKAEMWSGDGPIPDERIYEIAEELGLGYWGFYGALYGPPPVRAGIWHAVWGSLSQIKGSKSFFQKDVGPESILHSRAKTLSGTPNLLELDWISFLPNGAHAFFSPISPVIGTEATAQCDLIEKRCKEYGFQFITTFVIGWRELHNIVCLIYDRTDADQRRRMTTMIKQLIRDAAAHGWSEYRTANAFMDDVAATFDFNGGALMKFHETLKDALDPAGILAPGKCGVWPKRYRGRGL